MFYIQIAMLVFILLSIITWGVVFFTFGKFYNRSEKKWMLAPERKQYPVWVTVFNGAVNLISAILQLINLYHLWVK